MSVRVNKVERVDFASLMFTCTVFVVHVNRQNVSFFMFHLRQR